MVAKAEIFDISSLNAAGYGKITVYINSGNEPYPQNYNPLPDTEFESYIPDPGFVKNTGLRTPLFKGGFLSSPLLRDDDFQYIKDSQGYTWLYITFNYMAIEPFDRSLYPKGITRYSAAIYAPPPAGSIQVIINDKNQPQTFASKDSNGHSINHYFATDKHGNKFILGSIDSAYADDPSIPFEQAILPEGWTKSVEILNEDITIYPSYGDDNRRNYNQFRDNYTNNYFQVDFASNGKGIARGIPGLALVGGNEDNLITGTRLDETIYGAKGNDKLIGRGGNDQIWGDDGNDIIIGGLGADRLTGGTGRDTFRYPSLKHSVLSGVDRITDFQIGTDRLDGPRSVSKVNVRQLGRVNRLNQNAISRVLTTDTFRSNRAATFTLGSGSSTRTFIALNDGRAGFDSSKDAIIEITGYSGSLANLSIV
jgi:hypothetical protein